MIVLQARDKQARDKTSSNLLHDPLSIKHESHGMGYTPTNSSTSTAHLTHVLYMILGGGILFHYRLKMGSGKVPTGIERYGVG